MYVEDCRYPRANSYRLQSHGPSYDEMKSELRDKLELAVATVPTGADLEYNT